MNKSQKFSLQYEKALKDLEKNVKNEILNLVKQNDIDFTQTTLEDVNSFDERLKILKEEWLFDELTLVDRMSRKDGSPQEVYILKINKEGIVSAWNTELQMVDEFEIRELCEIRDRLSLLEAIENEINLNQ